MALARPTFDYVLPAGQALSGSDGIGVYYGGSGVISAVIDGTLALSGPSNGGSYVSGVLFDGGFSGQLTIGPAGSIRVTGGDVRYENRGIYGNTTPDILNRGTIHVTGGYDAVGVVSFASGARVENSGTIEVIGSGYGRAVWLPNSSNFINSGVISATATAAREGGVLYATTAVMIDRFTVDVVNSGTIRSSTGADPAATAMSISGGGRGAVFFNSGRLEGDWALFLSSDLGLAQVQRVVNTGAMVGAVRILGGSSRLENSGAITGNVQFGQSGDVYVGTGGTVSGAVAGGAGADQLIGGAGGERLLGELGGDTLSGGGGDDTLEGGEGADRLDGGDGLDTVSYAAAPGAVSVDLGAGTAGGDGPDTISGVERVVGSAFGDTLRGGSGDDAFAAGAGNDSIAEAGGSNYLRGDEGNDSIAGGGGFDDINGNMGDDTATGGLGDDWVIGGKDQDLLFGAAGNDLVYGNLGSDTCNGGDGADTILGGQANDLIDGGAGADFVSGDRGDDTVTGGAGADIFHTFAEAGIDRVLDFRIADGDRVMLDPGTAYNVEQVGADTVISMVGGGQMILVGVQLSSLPSGWIYEGF